MTIDQFVENFADLFDNGGEINAQTPFKELSEWNSLMALSVIAMVDEEYDVSIKGIDVQNAVTVEDLFNAVKGKL
ncbi:MAG: acyl carrier protein [Thermoguttaceae bacterium]|nr:acyl carrier protein [Thermoguttaceae bacterium]